MEDEIIWLSRQMVEAACEREVITRWEMDLYLKFWQKKIPTNLSKKIATINKRVLRSQKPG